jgi:ribosomal protein L32
MSDWPKTVRDDVTERSERVCERCGMARATHLHHRLFRRYGDHTSENALHVCGMCHHYIHAEPARSKKHGWIVEPPDTPKGAPVRYRGALVYLD